MLRKLRLGTRNEAVVATSKQIAGISKIHRLDMMMEGINLSGNESVSRRRKTMTRTEEVEDMEEEVQEAEEMDMAGDKSLIRMISKEAISKMMATMPSSLTIMIEVIEMVEAIGIMVAEIIGTEEAEAVEIGTEEVVEVGTGIEAEEEEVEEIGTTEVAEVTGVEMISMAEMEVEAVMAEITTSPTLHTPHLN